LQRSCADLQWQPDRGRLQHANISIFLEAWMSTLDDRELGGLDSVIAARKMTADLSDKYENIVIPINNNASIAHTGDNTGLKGGEGLSVDNLMRLRQNSFEQP
jgi:hypothetical protein